MNKKFLKTIAVFTSAAIIMSGSTMAFAENSLVQNGEKSEATLASVQQSEATSNGEAAVTTGSWETGDTQKESTENNSTKTDKSTETDAAAGTGSDSKTESTDGADTADKEAENIQESTIPEKPFSDFIDVGTHWAKDALNKAYNDGIIKGFEDSTMRPDDKITGAQMVTIITRIMNTKQQSDISSAGLDATCWYKEAAAEAVSLGIIDSSEVAGLNNQMVRREACAMLSDAFQLANGNPDMTKANAYTDFKLLSLNDKVIFASLVNNGYLQGYNSSLMLENDITRAEFITVLYRVAGDYIKTDEADNYTKLTTSAVVSGENFKVKDQSLSQNIWLDAGISSVDLEDVSAKNIVVRSDSLTNMSVKASKINKLVIAARSGAVDLNCEGISTTVIGDGSGAIHLSPDGNAVEITGSKRNVTLDKDISTLSVSGSGNTITVDSSADIGELVILGSNNNIKIDSDVKNLIIKGKNNTLTGAGKAEATVIYTSTSNIQIENPNVTNKIDNGLTGMTAAITAPEKVATGNNLQASVAFTNVAVGKTVKVIWYKDGAEAYSEIVTLADGVKPTLTYYIEYTAATQDSCTISCKVEYNTEDGTYQSVTAQTVTVGIQKPSILERVQTYYKGNYTTQWAIDNDLSDYDKECFVNAKGYSSSSQYLIWVNIGTQHTTVFQGSQGKWKLVRSGLVSTGASDCTPRGVFKTTYKQVHWTTSTYTVKPIVRFYGGGYAFHSRLYKPGTTTLKAGNSNGVGYPLSHGCVRMQADDIQWLYDNVPNGTTVVVY